MEEREFNKKEMNDFCPLIYEKRLCEMNPDDKVFEWRCFGRYRDCRHYMNYCEKNKQPKSI